MAIAQTASAGRVVGALACQKDSYLQSLETEVISCVKLPAPSSEPGAIKKKKSEPSTPPQDLWLVEFTDSVFFPEGGGQPSDQGTISPLTGSDSLIPIKFAQRLGLRCVLHSPQPLSPGSHVIQTIDFPHRWDHMQQHTGQHLLSAIMDTYPNLETLGWGMGSSGGMNYVDLPRKPTPEEISSIQDRCNEAIRNNFPITVSTPGDAEDTSLPGDYDKEKGVVRVISIGDIDHNTCCGTHLSQTSHISLILLHHAQPVHGKNTRLYFSAGDRAIKIATASIDSLRLVARTLGSGSAPEEVVTTVSKLNDSAAESRRKEKKLLGEIAKFEAEKVKLALKAGKHAWVHRAVEGLDFINNVVFEIRDSVKEGDLVVLASGEGKVGGLVVLFGGKDEVEGFVAKLKEVVTTIKGGGKGERWQGKVIEWKKGELDALRKLVEGEV